MTIGESAFLDQAEGGNADIRKDNAKIMAMAHCVSHGVYSTYISDKSNARAATQADYHGMKEGDNIYFFFNRNIYGIGRIISIDGDTAFFNNPDDMIYPEAGVARNQPYLCLFEAAPYFFKEGVDMDSVLESNPEAFHKLRFFYERSFIQIDDVENAALKSLIIQKHEQDLLNPTEKAFFPTTLVKETHDRIRQKYQSDKAKHELNPITFFKSGLDETKKCPNRIRSETYLEGLILDYVKRNNSTIGHWDFLSRQFPASPCKPPKYAYNMDLYGYRYVKGFEQDKIISKYVIIELKSQTITEDAVLQLLKYVDWVCQRFAHGDYSMIEAYVIGYDMEENLLENIEDSYTRHYIKSAKQRFGSQGVEVETGTWNDVKFISYLDILEEMKNSSSN